MFRFLGMKTISIYNRAHLDQQLEGGNLLTIGDPSHGFRCTNVFPGRTANVFPDRTSYGDIQAGGISTAFPFDSCG